MLNTITPARFFSPRRRFAQAARAAALGSAMLALAAFCPQYADAAGPPASPPQAQAAGPQSAEKIARLAPDTRVSAMLTLPQRNTRDLNVLIAALYDPASLQFGRYLTPAQFIARFAPTRADYNAVVAFARAQGLAVKTNDNRSSVEVQGRASVMEAAFRVTLNTYRTPTRTFYAPNRAARLPAALAGKVSGVVGLSNEFRPKPCDTTPNYSSYHTTSSAGTGVNGAFSPQDLRKAYGLEGVPATGKGQMLGIFLQGNLNPNDIVQYETQYRLPSTPLYVRYVDGYDSSPVERALEGEAALDVDMELAMSPDAKGIVAYSTTFADTVLAPLHALNAVAKDNAVSVFSVSYGLSLGSGEVSAAADQLIKQMAAQGISVCICSGDTGFDNDPGGLNTEPNVTVVGGTALITNPDRSYNSEEVWNDSDAIGQSGGGYDATVLIPSYQQRGLLGPFDTTTNGGSSQYRNFPDVAAEAAYYPGVSIFTYNHWTHAAGTSGSTPLWAGFLGTVNQVRVAAGLGKIGFANPALYSIAQLNNSDTFPYQGVTYPYFFKGAFHDTTFGDNANSSNTGSCVAGPGYDNVTGNGSFDGERMIGALCCIAGAKYVPPAVPTNFTAFPVDAGVALKWTAAKGARGYLVYRTPSPTGRPTSIGFLTAQTTTSYVDTAVTGGIPYKYSLMAVGPGGGIFAPAITVTP